MGMDDLRLRRDINSIFNVKAANINEPNVLAAIITAASKMAKCTNIVTEDMTVQQLLDLYKKSDDIQVASMIGMGPQYVKSNIGYAVDFSDVSAAQLAYQTNKENYDKLYSTLSQRAMVKAENTQIR